MVISHKPSYRQLHGLMSLQVAFRGVVDRDVCLNGPANTVDNHLLDHSYCTAFDEGGRLLP